MIYKAPHLSYEKIRAIASEFLAKYHSTGSIPVPIEHIIELQLEVDIVPYPRLRKDFDAEGMLSNDMATIYVDDYVMNKHENRYRFTLAHEIGHRILHRELYEQTSFSTPDEWISVQDSIDSNEYGWFEWQAYAFAGLTLVPIDQLIDQYRKAVDWAESEGYRFQRTVPIEQVNGYIGVILAKIFHVSESVISKRLQYDKLTPFDV